MYKFSPLQGYRAAVITIMVGYGIVYKIKQAACTGIRCSVWSGLKTSTQGKITTIIDNKYFEKMEYFKYLGTTRTNKNSTHEEITSRWKSGNVCYQSMQNL
jgi:hypothetical protein